ncbi:hypothetical protein T492DRAFT_875541 [Pavlovales sp. CCMP2436]|nr:hypothetical protein T492DRAFT_875541 [Pavlovales sp. CCMP2436]
MPVLEFCALLGNVLVFAWIAQGCEDNRAFGFQIETIFHRQAKTDAYRRHLLILAETDELLQARLELEVRL